MRYPLRAWVTQGVLPQKAYRCHTTVDWMFPTGQRSSLTQQHVAKEEGGQTSTETGNIVTNRTRKQETAVYNSVVHLQVCHHIRNGRILQEVVKGVDPQLLDALLVICSRALEHNGLDLLEMLWLRGR